MWLCRRPECNCETNRRRYLDANQVGADELVKTLTPLVAAVIRRILRYSREEHDEVQQIVFLKVFDKLSTWRGESALCFWVKQIAIREAFTQLRIEKRRKRPESLPPDDKIVDQKTQPLSPEVWKCVERTYNLLLPEKRCVYDLHVSQDMTVEQVAKNVGQSVRTIYIWLAELRERLLVCLD
jgi:RNA polymerase sigma factor (sigma-70 family)